MGCLGASTSIVLASVSVLIVVRVAMKKLMRKVGFGPDFFSEITHNVPKCRS